MADQLEEVLMEIEVKFGKGRSDSVIVRNNDDPTELAKAFVKRHGLKSSSIPIISQYLENTIESFLATYTSRDDDEEENPVNSSNSHAGSPPSSDQLNGNAHTFDDRKQLYEKESSTETASLKSDYISTVNTIYNTSSADVRNSREESASSLQSFSADSLSVSSLQGLTDVKSTFSESTYVTTVDGLVPDVRRIQSSLPIETNALNCEELVDSGANDVSLNHTVAKPEPIRSSSLKLNTSQPNTSTTNSLAKLFSTSTVTGWNPPTSERSGRVSSSRLEEFFGLGNKGLMSRSERAMSASQADSAHDGDSANCASTSRGMRTISLTSADARGNSSLSPALRNLSLSKEFSWFGRTRTSSRSETPVFDGSSSRSNEVEPSPFESSSKSPNHAYKEASVGICEAGINDDENNDPNQAPVDPLPPVSVVKDSVVGIHSPVASTEDIYDAMHPKPTAADVQKLESPFHPNYLDVLLENPELTLRSHSMSARSTSARIRSTGDMDLSLHEEKVANYVVQVSGNPLQDEESSAEELSFNAESCNIGPNSIEGEGEGGSDSSAEERYNRLKAFTATNKRPVIDYADDTSVFSSSGASRLRPSGSVMNMGASKNLEKNAKELSKKGVSSLVGKPVGERLFITAAINKSKKEGLENLKVVEMDRSIAKSQFKLNKQSKKIVQNLVRSGGSDDDDVHSRLHSEGVREKELRKKRAEDLKDYLKPEDWSCSRCGLFHRISTAGLGIHPIHNGLSASFQHQKQRVCSNCGWNQGETTPFHPVNIGLALLGNDETKTELLNNRNQSIQKQLLQDQSPGGTSGYLSGSKSKKASSDTIHNYLYENAKQKDTLQKLNQALVEESFKSLTFNPSIPAASKEIILQKYQQKQQQLQIQDQDSIAGTQNTSMKSQAAGNASLADYFSKPPAERLSITRTRDEENRKSKTPTRSTTRSSNHPKSAVNSESKLSTTKLKAGEVDKLVNRLTYEYKDKNARLKKESDKHHNFDAKTGKPLFRPVIPSLDACDSSLLNDSICSAETVSSRRRFNNDDVFTDILRRDDLLKQKRNLSQAKAIEDEMKNISANRVKALETSNSILKDSREKQIEELYRMLIVSTTFTASTNSMEGEAQEGNSNHILSDDVEDFKSRVLDFGLVHTDAMVPEVSALLRDMRREYEELCRLNRTETFQDTDEEEIHQESPLVTFDEFRKLALRAIKHRNGTGKAYICAPKKKPEVAMQMVIKNLKEETFRPTIDKNSLQLAQRPVTSKLKSVAIEDILHAEGERLKSKLEIARFEKFMKESKDYTYKPQLFKPPSYVKAKYRGLNESMSEPEQDFHHHPQGNYHGNVNDYYDDDNSTIMTDELMSVSNSVDHDRDFGLPPLIGGRVGPDRAEISYLSSGSPEDDMNIQNIDREEEGDTHRNLSEEVNVGVDFSRRFSGGTVDSHGESTVHEALELHSLHHQYNRDNIESYGDTKLDAFIDVNNHRRDSSNSIDSFSQQSPVRSEVADTYTRLKSMQSKHSINHTGANQDSDRAGDANNTEKWNLEVAIANRSHVNSSAPTQLRQSRSASKPPTFRPPPLPCDLLTNQSYSARKSKPQQQWSIDPEKNRDSLSPPPPPPPLSLLSSSNNDYYMQ